MKKLIFSCIAAVFVLVACSKETPTEPVAAATESEGSKASEELAALVDEFYERDLELNPLNATQIGDDRFDDRFPNFLGPEHITATEAMDEEFLERLLHRGSIPFIRPLLANFE